MAGSENLRIELVGERDMPSWFRYPVPFLRTVETGITRFRPWRILEGQHSTGKMAGLKERFPKRDLFPFALRTDCDDVACWERGDLDRVVVIHDFADPGWEQVAVFETFWDWLRTAIEDFIEFEQLEP
jgi:hypothetical protein